MKANHNQNHLHRLKQADVSDTSKILKWKQITTCFGGTGFSLRCFRYFKDTKMKANHNFKIFGRWFFYDVSDTSKILKWKQITTIHIHIIPIIRCFRYFKDTKMKANHNETRFRKTINEDVSDTSKILKWKQITTCFSYCPTPLVMFPILQRY